MACKSSVEGSWVWAKPMIESRNAVFFHDLLLSQQGVAPLEEPLFLAIQLADVLLDRLLDGDFLVLHTEDRALTPHAALDRMPVDVEGLDFEQEAVEAFGRLDAGRTCYVRRVAEDHGLADVIALLFANDFGLGETARGCVGHLWFLCLSVRLDPVPDAPNPVVGRRM